MGQHQLHLFEGNKLEITLKRLCHQLIEHHGDFSNSAIIGIQPRGISLSQRLHRILSELLPEINIPLGKLDVTFFRDDFRRHDNPLKANTTEINFLVEGKKVILVDDVLFTGRTVRAAMDALMAFGRPEQIELLILVDRLRKRELPIEPEYTGIKVDTLDTEKVIVRLNENEADKVYILGAD